jgi:dihydroxyacetone synthase
MCSVSNGLAAFNKGTFLPITSTFFMFYLVSKIYNSYVTTITSIYSNLEQYGAPGVRMGALQHLKTIHIATHDSIGMGEDGPTHQPIELPALYRAMPNLLYIRPCDSEEVAGAFIAALEAEDMPSILSLSRHNIEQYAAHSSRDGVLQGAYIFVEDPTADVTLIGVGAEMCFAVNTRKVLLERFGYKARIISFPCQRLFEAQSLEYRRQVLQYRSKIPIVVIEAYAVNGWERYADAGVSMSTFGHSLPGKVAYKHFGFNEEVIAPKVAELIRDVKTNGIESLRGEFRDLTVRSH